MPAYGATPNLRWQSLHADHAKCWSDLTLVEARADGVRQAYSASQLEQILTSANFNPAAQTVGVWRDQDLVAASVIWPGEEPRFDGLGEIEITLSVDPRHRGQGIEESLLTLCEALGALAAKRFLPARYVFRVEDHSQHSWKKELLSSRQYSLNRTFHVMERRTGAQISGSRPEPPAGVVVCDASLVPIEGIRVAHNAAFSQHWGSSPVSVDRWTQTMRLTSTRLDLSRVALDSNNQVLSYALVGQFAPHELHVLLVGTRPQHQGRGLGRAVLSEVLQLADGDPSITKVVIEVDSDRESPASGLYMSFGFKVVSAHCAYEKLCGPPLDTPDDTPESKDQESPDNV